MISLWNDARYALRGFRRTPLFTAVAILSLALGTLQGTVIWLVMREVLILIAVGIAPGVPLALALSGLVRSQLYGLQPHDPLTLILSTSLLAAVPGLAGFVSALRASRVNPINALRYE